MFFFHALYNACWVILHTFFSSADFVLKYTFFKNMFSGIPSECRTVWIWVHTVCKCSQHTTKVATSGERAENKLLDLSKRTFLRENSLCRSYNEKHVVVVLFFFVSEDQSSPSPSFTTHRSRAVRLLQFFLVCASVFLYVAFVLPLFVPYLYFSWYLGKAVLRDCGIP